MHFEKYETAEKKNNEKKSKLYIIHAYSAYTLTYSGVRTYRGKQN